MKLRIPSLDILVRVSIGITAISAIGLFSWLIRPHPIIVTNKQTLISATSPITGLPCDQATRRPIAVMLASDPEARPLTGLDGADIVFEIPVTPNGITRMMAVYQCGQEPRELGSIRSARQDFIPLAQGLKTVFAHWGGEYAALEQLNGHIIDNIDALLYEGSTFYRKRGAPAPHNGFSTLNLIREKASSLGYTASSSTPAYPHQTSRGKPSLASFVGTAFVNWPQGMGIRFSYDATTDMYLRERGGKPEIDASTKQQIRVSVVVIMQTTATFLRDQYIHVNTIGQGAADIYQNGSKVSGTWKKLTATDTLEFYDTNGKIIPFTPGPIWVAIDARLNFALQNLGGDASL